MTPAEYKARREIRRILQPKHSAPVRLILNGWRGYGEDDAEAIADLLTKLIFKTPYFK